MSWISDWAGGGLPLAVLLGGIGLVAILLPELSARRRRRDWRRREAYPLPEWVARFCPGAGSELEIVENVLRLAGDVYGITPTKLRPGDSLLEYDGRLKGVAMDDALPTLVEGLQKELHRTFALRWRPERQLATISDLIGDVLTGWKAKQRRTPGLADCQDLQAQ